jgi:hypothetical protein
MDIQDKNIVPLDCAFIMVNEKPCAIWEYYGFKESTLNFLNGIEPNYFSYLAKVHGEKLHVKKHRQNAAIALRTGYSFGLETFFSLLFSYIQAPHCVQAWMNLYEPGDIGKLVKKVTSNLNFNMAWTLNPVSWRQIAKFILNSLVIPDPIKDEAYKNAFGDLWSKLAYEFNDESFQREYNSLKHGMRLKAGGFYLAFKTSPKNGSQDGNPISHMLSQSEFGSSFLKKNKVGENNRHLYFSKTSRNWDPEDIASRLEFLALSLSNLISTIKIFWGVDPKKVRYSWPREIEHFNIPWKNSLNFRAGTMTMHGQKVDKSVIEDYTPELIIENYKKGIFTSRKFIKFVDPV